MPIESHVGLGLSSMEPFGDQSLHIAPFLKQVYQLLFFFFFFFGDRFSTVIL